MVLALPVVLGILLGLAVRGDVRAIATLRLRRVELFYLAVVLQLVAYPLPFMPWSTNGTVATMLWLGSYGLLFAGAIANRRIVGVPVIAAGMASNVVAVAANGGHMPALPQALRAAHKHYTVHFNSTAKAHPHLAWLVDRWAVPHWIHLGNVYSVGDVVIAVGVVLLVVAAMQPRRSLLRVVRRRTDASRRSAPPVDALDPISPELALISPELAERARQQLAPRPWEAFLPAT